MVKLPRFEKTELTTEVYGQPFTFELCHRRVLLGPELEVHYYWMDGSDMRKGIGALNSGLQNVTNCIQLWWRVAMEKRRHGELNVLQQLLLADVYPLFAKSKGQQSVFLDAYLRGKLRTSANGRFIPSEEKISPQKIAKPLHALLLGSPGSKHAQQFATATIAQILSIGTTNLIANPSRGLLDFREELTAWVAKHRRKPAFPWMPWTLDLLAYSSKVAFYECYSTAWMAIVDELERQGLDDLSLTFLNIWHFQDFCKAPNKVQPGPLGGIPLSMHPISAYLMRIPQLAAACGDFVKERADRGVDLKQLAKQKSYRVFCQAIEFAANQYRSWHSIQSEVVKKEEGDKCRPSRSTRPVSRSSRPQFLDDAHVSDSDSYCSALTDCLRHRGDQCTCGGEIEVVELDSMRVRGETITFSGQCRLCRADAKYKIDAEELEGS